MAKRKSGYVYVLGRDDRLDIVRVGCTIRNPWRRAEDLKYGSPCGYLVLCYVTVPDQLHKVENTAHEILRPFAQGNDWYLCKPDVAYRAIKEAILRVERDYVPRIAKR